MTTPHTPSAEAVERTRVVILALNHRVGQEEAMRLGLAQNEWVYPGTPDKVYGLRDGLYVEGFGWYENESMCRAREYLVTHGFRALLGDASTTQEGE